MTRVLVLTPDLPYFPGKMGVDFFHLRHLAASHQVAVVAPCHDHVPPASLANLESAVDALYLWPRPVTGGDHPLLVNAPLGGRLRRPLAHLPAAWRRTLLRRLLGLTGYPDSAYDQLAVLANCAPQLLAALRRGPWQAMVLVQTSIASWWRYLPRSAAKIAYCHDIRSDYLARHAIHQGRAARNQARRVAQEERQLLEQVDGAGFVSPLDRDRADALAPGVGTRTVVPIAIDLDYFRPDRGRHPSVPPVVLFTGHLSHPPNVDAVRFFLDSIWPQVLQRQPAAMFCVAGMLPADELRQATAAAPRCQLLADVVDIRPCFQSASVYVVPMRFGGGVRQKILEAWAMEVPVVCTAMAMEGIADDGARRHWHADTADAFAEAVAALLERGPERQVIEAARRFVRQHHAVGQAAPAFATMTRVAIQARRARPYRLLYDLRWMTIGHAGGMEQAVFELLRTISRIDHTNAYRLLAPRRTCSEWRFPPGFNHRFHYSDAGAAHVETVRSFVANQLAGSLGKYPVLTPAMRSLALCHRLDYDLLHSPVGYTHPDLAGAPAIVTVHDLQHLHLPGFFSVDELAVRDRLYRDSVAGAAHIICISEFTRQDVHSRYGVPLDRMTTIWNHPVGCPGGPLTETERQALLADMSLTRPFLFYPAHDWPHKNHLRLFQAFQHALPRLPDRLVLACSGRGFAPDHPAAQFIAEQGLSDRIVHLGYRSPRQMHALYQACLALVFPSLFEGFGLPVAEAIAGGTPVACSSAGSLPEVAGQAALLFDATRVPEIADAICAIATSAHLRQQLTAAALVQRTRYSALRSAVATLAVYQRVHRDLYGGAG
jgi:glycosyltransferase involved in cell wall biosynthesis